MAKVFLSLGSNLGNKEQNLMHAIASIGKDIGKVQKISGFYQNKAQGFTSDNLFLNTAIEVLTNLQPFELLEKTEAIECEMGRKTKTSTSYSDRLIDIDILLYEDVTVNTQTLIIPHPRMLERDFVLIPLREIAPELAIFNT